jgi:hypothetical protein
MSKRLDSSLYVNLAASEIRMFDKFLLFLRKDRIVELVYDDFVEGTIEDAKTILKTIGELSPGNKVPLMVIYGDNNEFDKDVREFIAGDAASECRLPILSTNQK